MHNATRRTLLYWVGVENSGPKTIPNEGNHNKWTSTEKANILSKFLHIINWIDWTFRAWTSNSSRRGNEYSTPTKRNNQKNVRKRQWACCRHNIVKDTGWLKNPTRQNIMCSTHMQRKQFKKWCVCVYIYIYWFKEHHSSLINKEFFFLYHIFLKELKKKATRRKKPASFIDYMGLWGLKKLNRPFLEPRV